LTIYEEPAPWQAPFSLIVVPTDIKTPSGMQESDDPIGKMTPQSN